MPSYLSRLKQLLPSLSPSTRRSPRAASRKRTVHPIPKASACHSWLFDLTPVSPSSYISSFRYVNQPSFADCKDLAGEQNLGGTWQIATASQGTWESTITLKLFRVTPTSISGCFLVGLTDMEPRTCPLFSHFFHYLRCLLLCPFHLSERFSE